MPRPVTLIVVALHLALPFLFNTSLGATEVQPIVSGESVLVSSEGPGWKFYSIEAEEGDYLGAVEMHVASSSARLFVRHGDLPTPGDYDCLAEDSSLELLCTPELHASGLWFIGVETDSAIDGARLEAWVRYDLALDLEINMPQNLGALGADDLRVFRILVPPERSQVLFALDPAGGDVEMSVRFGEPPTPIEFDCLSQAHFEPAVCELDSPEAGYWFIRIRSFGGTDGAILTVETPSSDPYPEGPVCDLPDNAYPESPETLDLEIDDLDPRFFAEDDTWVDLDAIAELSETTPYVRVVEGLGTVSSIHGDFRGSDPLQIFEQILAAGGIDAPMDQWTILGEGEYEPDARYSVLTLERRNDQGLPLAGGTVNLVFDGEGIVAVEGRHAGQLPEVEPAQVSVWELEERWPEYDVDGPFLFVPEILAIPGVELGSEPGLLFSLADEQNIMFADGSGLIRWHETVTAEMPQIAVDFYRSWVLDNSEPWQVCSDRVLKKTWNSDAMKLFMRYLVRNQTKVAGATLLRNGKTVYDVNWSSDDWMRIMKTLVAVNNGCGSIYHREPPVDTTIPTRPGYHSDATFNIWSEKIAVKLWFEATWKPTWTIDNLSKAGQENLFDMTLAFDDYQCGSGRCYHPGAAQAGSGLSHRPLEEFLWMSGSGMIDRSSALKTAGNLGDFIRSHVHHGESGYDFVGNMGWTRNRDPEHLQMLSRRYRGQGNHHGFLFTTGCWQTTGTLCTLLQNLNISCRNKPESISLYGAHGWSKEYWAMHSRPVLIDLGLTMQHADDFYLGNLIPMQVNHGHLYWGPHEKPGQQSFLFPNTKIFDSEKDFESILNRRYAGYHGGVRFRGISNNAWDHTITLITSYTSKDESRFRALRRWEFGRRGKVIGANLWSEFEDNRILGYTLSDKERRVCASFPRGSKPAHCSDDIVNWMGDGGDFALHEREQFYCEKLKIIKSVGITTICNSWSMRNDPICTRNPLQIPGPPPGCTP